METKFKILVVEDDALIAENLRLTLEDLGYSVTAVCYGYQDAMQALRARRTDLALLDINLGGRDEATGGLAVAEGINSEFRIPFIFLTAYDDAETIRRATKLRPSGYLIKPVNPATVFAAVQTAIEHSMVSGADPLPVERAGQPDYFFVRLGPRNLKLLWENVYCIEAGRNYVKLRVANAGTEYPIRGTLRFVLENLVPASLKERFIRINRSISLNLRYITMHTGDSIYCGEEAFENTRFTIKELQALLERERRR